MLPLKETRSGCQLSPDFANFRRLYFWELPTFAVSLSEDCQLSPGCQVSPDLFTTGVPTLFGLPTLYVFLSTDCQLFRVANFLRISFPPGCKLYPDVFSSGLPPLSGCLSLRFANFLRISFLLPTFSKSLLLRVANFSQSLFSGVPNLNVWVNCQLYSGVQFPILLVFNFLGGLYFCGLPTSMSVTPRGIALLLKGTMLRAGCQYFATYLRTGSQINLRTIHWISLTRTCLKVTLVELLFRSYCPKLLLLKLCTLQLFHWAFKLLHLSI